MSRLPQMHHVVYAVARDRLDAAATFFTELGFESAVLELAELGHRVTLDWAGVELVTPLDTEAGRSSAVAEYLAAHGDGVFSIAVRVADMAAAEQVAARYGAVTKFRSHREGEGFEPDESEMTVQGLPLTFVATDLP